jgi:hypothetical protein
VPLSVNVVSIVTCWPAETWVAAAILFCDVVPLLLLYFQESPTVVGNGRAPEPITTEDWEAELVAAADAVALEPPPEVAAPVVAAPVVAPADADGVVLPHPVRTRPAAAAPTAKAPAVRRTFCP